MGKTKFYAVRVGNEPGIYESWEECKKNIDGYRNAQYKAFATREEALAYLNNEDITKQHKSLAKESNTVIAYVDGSYSESASKYSFGCILITPQGEVIKKSGLGDDPKALLIRNVAGELQGAMYAVKTAYELGYSRVLIRHDYIGIAKWHSKEWKAKDEVAKIYVEYMEKLGKSIEIDFEKVQAHSGDKYNEEADKLARSAFVQSDEVAKKEDNNELKNIPRELLIKIIGESIMESKEVTDYLKISSQQLTALNKSGKLVPIKKGIYLKLDVEAFDGLR
jgi:ribonuclease HI